MNHIAPQPVPYNTGQDASRPAHPEPKWRSEDPAKVAAQLWIELQVEVLQRKQTEATLDLRTAQLKEMSMGLAQAGQIERERLAGILHDSLQQLLVAVKLKIAALVDPTHKENLSKAIREVNALLDSAIEQTRFLTVELSPPILFKGGLVPALEWLARWMRQKHGLKIQVTADERATEAGAGRTQLVLFDAVRELLFNVTKHAKAKTADVQVQRVDGRIQIVVADSGIGFDTLLASASDNPSTSLGLFRIHKRLGLLGGRFEIDSIPGKGSRFTLQAPIDV